MTLLMVVRVFQTMCFNVYISAYFLTEHGGCIKPGEHERFPQLRAHESNSAAPNATPAIWRCQFLSCTPGLTRL
jgi:hypothetical protein